MIKLKNKNDIENLRQGGKILAGIMKEIIGKVKPGVTTGELEELACGLIEKAGGRPSFKGYKSGFHSEPFPSALCTSINYEIVHAPALPPRVLNNGDIVGIDIGMEYPFGKGKKGYFTDMAVTVGVGEIGQKEKKLIKTTEESLSLAISKISAGKKINDIGVTIQDFVEKNGFSVVRDLVGHGVGYAVHEDPQVPNFRIDEKFNFVLESGLVLAIEPMVNVGSPETDSSEDGFTIETTDKKPSAHFEHTIVVTDKGCEVLTKI